MTTTTCNDTILNCGGTQLVTVDDKEAAHSANVFGRCEKALWGADVDIFDPAWGTASRDEVRQCEVSS